MAVVHQHGFSTRVRLKLLVRDEEFTVAQVGEDSLILREPWHCEPGTKALLVISIDREDEEYSIVFPEGVSGKLAFFRDDETWDSFGPPTEVDQE